MYTWTIFLYYWRQNPCFIRACQVLFHRATSLSFLQIAFYIFVCVWAHMCVHAHMYILCVKVRGLPDGDAFFSLSTVYVLVFNLGSSGLATSTITSWSIHPTMTPTFPFFLFINFTYFYFMCLGSLPECKYMYHINTHCLHRSEGSIRFPGTAVTDNCDRQFEWQIFNLHLLQECKRSWPLSRLSSLISTPKAGSSWSSINPCKDSWSYSQILKKGELFDRSVLLVWWKRKKNTTQFSFVKWFRQSCSCLNF